MQRVKKKVDKSWMNISKYTSGFFCEEPKTKGIKYVYLYFLVISTLELVSYLKGYKFITAIASRIWILGGIFCFGGILYYFAKAVKNDIVQRNILSLVTLSSIVLYLFWICGKVNLTDINPDATQQAAAGLDSFSVFDFNYTGKAFLGYPNRQYILVAVPAFLFGRSITTLQLGFAFPFILGILSLYSGLHRITEQKGISGKYVIVSIASLFAFRFVTEYYINFEQAILPIALTMILIGLFLNLLCKPDILSIISIAWIGCLCSNSYTPVLASLGLLIALLTLLSFILLFVPGKLIFPVVEKLCTAKLLLAVNVNILLFFIATLLGKRSDRVSEIRADIDILPFSGESIYGFLTDKNAVFFGYMGVIILLYLILSLTMQFKAYHLIISLWVLCVFVASNLLVGYTAYSSAWIMQRALIVIPVLVTGISLALYDFIQKYNFNGGHKLLASLIAMFIFLGIHNLGQMNQSFTYFHYIQPMKYMLSDLEKTTNEQGLSHIDSFQFVLYTNNLFMQNPADYFKFLYPNATVYLGTYGEFPEDIDLSLPIIIYGEDEIEGMTPYEDIHVVLYNNKRYQTAGLWYKICVIN